MAHTLPLRSNDLPGSIHWQLAAARRARTSPRSVWGLLYRWVNADVHQKSGGYRELARSRLVDRKSWRIGLRPPVLVITREQDCTQWGPERLLAGGATIAIHGMLIAVLATTARFQLAVRGASTPSHSLTYVSVAPVARNSARIYTDHDASAAITLPEPSAVPRLAPFPIIVVPEVEIVRPNWVDEVHRASVAELAREQSVQRSIAVPSGSDSSRDIDPSAALGIAAWDAAKPKGLQFDDYETRLWVNEHCYLFVGQPAPQQNLGAKCRLGSGTPLGDLFEDRRAKAPTK
jgi:hypothetical protein